MCRQFCVFLSTLYLFSCELQNSNKNEIHSGLNSEFSHHKVLNKSLSIKDDTINLDTYTIEKPVLIYLSTEWCTGCKQVEKWYFNNNEIKDFLDEHYHLIKIDGDYSTVILNGKKYGVSFEYNNRHDLNLVFSKGWFGYPNFLIFNKDLSFLSAFEPEYFMGVSSEEFINKLGEATKLKLD